MSAPEVIDGTVVEEPGTALVPAHDPAPATLFRTDDPVEVIEKAGRVADALKAVLRDRGMLQNIQGREHVKVEGWQTLGSMLGVVPVVVSTRELEDGWEARVEARTLDGRVVGAAEAMCTRAERMWSKRDPYALRSMAQTRATSKALKGPLGFIVTLAGYEATPADEMPHEPRRVEPERTGASDIPTDLPIDSHQYDALKALFAQAGQPAVAVAQKLDELDVPANDDLAQRIATLTTSQADDLTGFLSAMRGDS